MTAVEHVTRRPVATSILVGLAVLAACLGALWLVLAIGVRLAG